jgi:hypothetical protein
MHANNIVTDEDIYEFNKEEYDEYTSSRPWKNEYKVFN